MIGQHRDRGRLGGTVGGGDHVGRLGGLDLHAEVGAQVAQRHLAGGAGRSLGDLPVARASAQPPATAGRIVISPLPGTAVPIPSRKRMSSPPT